MNFIVDDIGTVVNLMRSDVRLVAALTSGLPPLISTGYQAGMPYYMFGHRVEISSELNLKENDKVYKYQKYPLVALRLDTTEENSEGLVEYNLNIALVMHTDKNWIAAERYVNVFKPVLYPMYESFLKALITSGLFMWQGLRKRPVHSKIDRPFWGTSGTEGNTAGILGNDPLDAIELIDLKLTQQIKC